MSKQACGTSFISLGWPAWWNLKLSANKHLYLVNHAPWGLVTFV